MEKSNKPSFFIANLANHFTILRILLAPAFIGCLLYYSPQAESLRYLAALVFLAACLTDALDGYIARRLNQKSDFGSYIDPIADKLLLTSGFLALSFMNNIPPDMKMPAWVTIAVISRDVIIVTGSTLIFLAKGSLKAQPLFVGKLTTVFQMGSLLALLLLFPPWFSRPLFVVTTALTILSGFLYIRIGERIFQNNNHTCP